MQGGVAAFFIEMVTDKKDLGEAQESAIQISGASKFESILDERATILPDRVD